MHNRMKKRGLRKGGPARFRQDACHPGSSAGMEQPHSLTAASGRDVGENGEPGTDSLYGS